MQGGGLHSRLLIPLRSFGLDGCWMQSVAKSGSRLFYITTLHKGTCRATEAWMKHRCGAKMVLQRMYIYCIIYIYMYIQNIAYKGNCIYIVPMLCQKVFNLLLFYMHKCIGFEHCVVVAHK